MKPSIPDTGTVIGLAGEQADVRVVGDGSCRKCGAAALGLCKAGRSQVLTVRNAKQARPGDRVTIGLAQGVQARAYLLGFVIPAAALVFGAFLGHALTALAGLRSMELMDAATGLVSMIAASFFSLRRLKRLSASSSIEIVKVLVDPRHAPADTYDTGPAGEQYLSGN